MRKAEARHAEMATGHTVAMSDRDRAVGEHSVGLAAVVATREEVIAARAIMVGLRREIETSRDARRQCAAANETVAKDAQVTANRLRLMQMDLKRCSEELEGVREGVRVKSLSLFQTVAGTASEGIMAHADKIHPRVWETLANCHPDVASLAARLTTLRCSKRRFSEAQNGLLAEPGDGALPIPHGYTHDDIFSAIREVGLVRPDAYSICTLCGRFCLAADAAGHHYKRHPSVVAPPFRTPTLDDLFAKATSFWDRFQSSGLLLSKYPNLNRNGAIALLFFTLDIEISVDMNSALERGTDGERFLPFLWHVHTAMTTMMPRMVNKPITATATADVSLQSVSGWRSFRSLTTAAVPNTAATVLVVRSSRAVSLADFSDDPREGEVVLPPYAPLRVVGGVLRYHNAVTIELGDA